MMTRALSAAVVAAFAFAVTIAIPQPAAADPGHGFQPEASGTTVHYPEFDILQVAPVGTDVQSTYFRTTLMNREFRRGIAEFRFPPAPVRSATLVLRETRGTGGFPVPADVHVISFYRDVDLAVTAADHYRASTPIGTITTDVNEEPQTFSVDVTAAFVERGREIGFRINLADDPAYMGFGSRGSAFVVELVLTFGAGHD